MTDPPPGWPPPAGPPPAPPPPGSWGPPPPAPPAPPPAGWGSPPDPPPAGWGSPPDPPPAGWGPPPDPPPPPGRRTGLVVGLGVGVVAAVLLAVLVVVAAVTVLRSGRAADAAPRVGAHWHVPYAVYVCDRALAPVRGDGDQGGIHSHSDGTIHVEPVRRSSAGRNATFRRFEEAQGLRITSTSLRWLDGSVPVVADVGQGCGGREAEIVTFVDGRRVAGAPGSVRLRDGQGIVVALVAVGTSYEEIHGP